MDMRTIEVAVGEFTLICHPDDHPAAYDHYRAHAKLVEQHNLQGDTKQACLIAVRRGPMEWPFLAVVIGHTMGWWHIGCGALLIPETHVLLIGADDTLVAYDLSGPAMLWRDKADYGFWSWHRHRDTVLMAAELEMAAWDIEGRKRWSTFVEPPWDYTVSEETVNLTVMGVSCSFPLATGPKWGANLPWLQRH